MGRITHCPETGVDLSTVGIRKHAEKLWPADAMKAGANDPRCEDARQRKAAVLAEADARDREAKHASQKGEK